MSDHTLGLEGLAAELARAVQPQMEAGQLQGTMAAALKSMLSRSNPGFKALSGGLTKVLFGYLEESEPSGLPLPNCHLRDNLAQTGSLHT